jgi:hypothetical protein
MLLVSQLFLTKFMAKYIRILILEIIGRKTRRIELLEYVSVVIRGDEEEDYPMMDVITGEVVGVNRLFKGGSDNLGVSVHYSATCTARLDVIYGVAIIVVN